MMQIFTLSFCFAFLAFGQVAEEGQLKTDEHLMLVRANCTPCHSEKLITQNRGTEDEWRALIRWMQKTQGLWQIPSDSEQKIVAYLAKNYPPSPNRRRKPIPPDQMPPSPAPPPDGP